MRKILYIFILLLLITGCTNNVEPVERKEIPDSGDIVQPNTILPNSTILQSIDENTAKMFTKDDISGDMNDDNLYFVIGKDAPKHVVKDINGNEVDLGAIEGEWIFEVVANWCSHCKAQVKITEDLLKKNPNLKIVQYFDQGTEDEIKIFYEEAEGNIDDLTVIPFNSELYSYLNGLWIDSYPSFYFIKDGKIAWLHTGEMDNNKYKNIKKYAYENKYDVTSLLTKEGYPLRTKTHVKNDLGVDKLLNIYEVDENIEGTLNFTVANVGKVIDFDKTKTDKVIKDAIGDNVNLSTYKQDNVVIFTLKLEESENYKVSNNDIIAINEISKLNPNNKYLLLILDETDGKDIEKFDIQPNIDVVSLYSEKISPDFNKIEFSDLPSMLMIKNGVVTGYYIGINTIENASKAIDIFLGESPVTAIK